MRGEVDERGGTISFSSTFVFVLLIYLVLLSPCLRRFGSVSIWWSICCVVRSFVLGFVSVGVLHLATVSVNRLLFRFIFFPCLWFSLAVLELRLGVGGLLVLFSVCRSVAAFMGLSVHAFTQCITPCRKVQRSTLHNPLSFFFLPSLFFSYLSSLLQIQFLRHVLTL